MDIPPKVVKLVESDSKSIIVSPTKTSADLEFIPIFLNIIYRGKGIRDAIIPGRTVMLSQIKEKPVSKEIYPRKYSKVYGIQIPSMIEKFSGKCPGMSNERERPGFCSKNAGRLR